jgi:predicted nucleic-acid-binding protein
MRAIDANLLVRLLARDDTAQTARAETFIENGAWVSHLVLAETVRVLDSVFARTPTQIARAIELMLDHKQLVLQDPETIAAALERFRARPTLGFSDCLVLEIARKAGHLPLGTFDRTLGRADGAEAV